MNSKLRLLLNLFFCSVLLTSCSSDKPSKLSETDLLHQNEFLLTQVIIYDVFTPPVASRIYVYSSQASYEALRYSKPDAPSITEKLNGFKKMPEPEKGKK